MCIVQLLSVYPHTTISRWFRCKRLGFDLRTGQTEHSVANGWSPLLRFFEAVLPRRKAVTRALLHG